jgi:hypothetical protein
MASLDLSRAEWEGVASALEGLAKSGSNPEIGLWN